MARENMRYYTKRQAVDRVATILAVVFVILAIASAVTAFFLARNVFANWNMTELGPGMVQPSGSNAAGGQPGKIPELPSNAPKDPLQEAGAGPENQAWDGNTRVTLLVMGLDYRDCESEDNFAECDDNGASRTDSMMLVTVDPVSKSGGMLSIPRDLWVSIPGFDYGKINTAYFLGEAYKVPGGGPTLAMQTVEALLGVPIQYYAQIDFNAFVRIIDEMGGLDMHIKEEIIVDPLGPGNTRKLEPGVQTLDGATVLAYARNRHTEGGDFDRAKRQQEVILAVRQQVLQFNMLPTLVTKAPAMYKEVQNGVRTNLTLQQVVQLAILMQSIPEQNIKRGVIGPPEYITYDTSPDGLSIEIPVPDQIRLLRDEIFASGGPVGPAAAQAAIDANGGEPTLMPGDPVEMAKVENARIIVLNGSSTEGLASRTAEYLRGLGLNIIGESNADQAFNQSTIIDYTGKPYTARYLVDLLGMDTSRVVSRYDPNAQVDIEVILGSAFAENNPLP
jgi:LCP family protein required for cell wall assembly